MKDHNIAVSSDLFLRARRHLPGGVNSPVRAFNSVGGIPPFIREATGARITDVDGNVYIDYVMSYGPMLLGHAPEAIVKVISEAATRGTAYGAPTKAEVELAELVCEMVPSVEMVRFVNSGSEATASAIRLARGVTNKPKIVKCSGCFHGSVDSLLVSAGSGAATLGLPGSAGVPETIAAETIVVEFNHPEAMSAAFEQFGDEIAAVILEPVPANMGVVLPETDYLKHVRELTSRHGALLIFDEVISGFRLGPAGAQGLFNVQPDLTCFGKIVGGGLPSGAYGGRKDLMEQLAPLGPVYQAGTLSGNPITTAAGLAMLREIRDRGPALYEKLNTSAQRLKMSIVAACSDAGFPVYVQQIGSLLTPFFTKNPVRNYSDARSCDTKRFSAFFKSLLTHGIYVPPSQYEAWFLSAAHSNAHIEATAEVIHKAAATAGKS